MKNLIRGVVKIILGIFIIISFFISGCVASLFSGFITTKIDYSTKDMEGITYYQGFSVWFNKRAEGIGPFSGFHLPRFQLNCLVWVYIFIVISLCFIMWRYFVKKRRLQQHSAR